MKKYGTYITDAVQLLIGVTLMAAAYRFFFIPNAIAPGGVSGVGTILNALFQWPVGVVTIVINIPLFALGWRLGGRGFMFRSLLAMLLSALLIDYLPFPGDWLEGLTGDTFLSTVVGGVLCGAGVGLVYRSGSSTGGTDLAAALLRKVFHGLPEAWILFGLDALVVAASAVFLGPKQALYALVAIFIAAKVTDFIQMGVHEAKCFWIITNFSDEIAGEIFCRLERGVTRIAGKGMYSGKDRDILLCVVSPRELLTMKAIIAGCDPKAFVLVHSVSEVLGEGFTASRTVIGGKS